MAGCARWPGDSSDPVCARVASVNELCWITLQVPDLERSRTFWRDVLGLPEHSATPHWVELRLREGILLALHSVFHSRGLERRGYDRGGPVLGLQVESLDDMRALVERHGARALGRVNTIPGGRSQDFEDPDGYVFELVERAGAERAGAP